MKGIILTAIIFCGLLVGCKEDEVLNFIPGTYVRSVKNEFSVGRDTLVIIKESTNLFSIIHQGIYQRIYQWKISPVRSFSEKWSATYDEDKKSLIETRKGKIFSFNTYVNVLYLGTSRYNKISRK
ncbi:MAG: hypothetical protein ACTHJN_11060 [Ginsengibacter sp.]